MGSSRQEYWSGVPLPSPTRLAGGQKSRRLKTLSDKSREAKVKNKPRTVPCLPKYSAGLELLSRYEDTWAALHRRAKECASAGERVDSEVVMLSAHWEKKQASLRDLQQQLQQLPGLIADLESLTASLTHLEASFEEVENHLLNLEDLCGQCELERHKHMQSQQLENYKKNKRKELETFKEDAQQGSCLVNWRFHLTSLSFCSVLLAQCPHPCHLQDSPKIVRGIPKEKRKQHFKKKRCHTESSFAERQTLMAKRFPPSCPGSSWQEHLFTATFASSTVCMFVRPT
nr:dysbindin isoform X1 [Ovis aries]